MRLRPDPDLSEVDSVRNLSNFIADEAGNGTGLSIVENNGLATIQPTGLPVDTSPHHVHVKRDELIHQRSAVEIEHLASPTDRGNNARNEPG